MAIDNIDGPGPLTKYDYGYLKGDTEMYQGWGAAVAVVMEWCKNMGYGKFGEPTESGLEAMKQYEKDNKAPFKIGDYDDEPDWMHDLNNAF